MRVRLIVEYDGTDYAGWQRQDNHITVQEAIEDAIIRVTGQACRVTGASRTDSGVHAIGQVAHFDYDGAIPAHKFSFALNTWLPRDVRIRASEAAPEDFHARFSARGKRYRYRIDNRIHAGALCRRIYWHMHRKLDFDAMRIAAGHLVGEHDFRAFMAAGGQSATTVRTIHAINVTHQDGLVDIIVEGDGFLYNMVRIIVGTLVYVGIGKLTTDATRVMLETGDRETGGPTAPPQGLTLEEVFYDPLS